MASASRCLNGALLAAAFMYWFDPASGRRRRARLRDRIVSTMHDVNRVVDAGSRDLSHRMTGLIARTRSVFDNSEVDDEVLAERVRTCLGRVVSHPGAIDVDVSDGRVVLSGTVLAGEYRRLLRAVRSVRGVREIREVLAVHEHANGIPALQGGRPRTMGRFELLQENWAPGIRLVTSAAGSTLMLQGLRSRTLLGALGAVAGGALLIRSVTNTPLKRLVGGAGRRAIDIHKTLHIAAPAEQVFQTLARFEDYPLFMHNVREVRMYPDGRSHWTVAGPAGIPVEWISETTQLEPNRFIAWRTVPGSPVQHAGVLRIEPFDGGTRLDIQMSYNPPAGALGHAMARMCGADPKSELDRDLLRLKTFIETGKRPRDAARRRIEAAMPASEPDSRPIAEPQRLEAAGL